MKPIFPITEDAHPIAQVVNIQEEKKIEKEAQALVELHDFIKSHPDSPVKEIARFMPPVDSRAVSKAIQMLAIRDQSITQEEKDKAKKEAESIDVGPNVGKWGRRSE